MDLAVLYFIPIAVDERGIASYAVTNAHFEMLNIPEMELFTKAAENTAKKFPAVIKPLCEMLEEQLGADEFPSQEQMLPIYVLSNRTNCNGASAILYRNMLDELREKCGAENIYMLPSSIHEWLLIPESEKISTDYLRQIVQDVNSTVVRPEDYLSGEVYVYDGATGNIRVAA